MPRTRPQIPGLASAPAKAPAPAAGAARGAIGRGVYDAIRTAILDCTFVPGMALSEQAVSEQLQVSRAPVREAFRQLVVEGLLEAVPQRGTFVSRLDRGKIADAIFVREAIECRAAELAAAAPLPQKKKLAQIVQWQAGASARKDYSSHLSADEEFHHAILELAGHPHAWNSLRLARTGMNRIRHLAIPTVGSHRIAIDHHRAIVDAIVRGDGRAAAKAMQVHIHSPLVFLDAIAKAHPEYFTG
ncbi:GntR family transcriptional regulator [Ramlibacter humi]|uniref:GntR family transcriptional regulator n=1 Tax=Ramlibacter humi TaxID=2530451 RepID=A0A4Z0C7M8_9BURK|nr:GntR family transcriptional regulator [Ramlibacter humi]TFZ07603.1 GntR family transcriptional regulator [Ramlibacter humi]